MTRSEDLLVAVTIYFPELIAVHAKPGIKMFGNLQVCWSHNSNCQISMNCQIRAYSTSNLILVFLDLLGNTAMLENSRRNKLHSNSYITCKHVLVAEIAKSIYSCASNQNAGVEKDSTVSFSSMVCVFVSCIEFSNMNVF